ncbi:MAG: LytTR family DNA-binding domain-containing protein [bacterium]
MKVSFEECPALEEPEVTIRAAVLTPELRGLIASLTRSEPIRGYRGEEVTLLPLDEILRFFTEGKGVAAETEEGVWSVRERLYELEARLDGHRFVRISQAEIINLRHITALDLSFSGTVQLTLTGGRKVFSSQRYIKKLKEAVGL